MVNNICLLVNPMKFQPGENAFLPLGLMAVAGAFVAEGIEVHFFDGAVMADLMPQVINAVNNLKPAMVGFSVMTCMLEVSLELSKKIKQLSPETKIVWGGVHPSLFPAQVVANSIVDVAVIGEGHRSLVALYEKIISGHSWATLPGIARAENGKITVNPVEHNKTYDLPRLPYHLLDISKYVDRNYSYIHNLPWAEPQAKTLDVISSIGCPYRCSFCINVAQQRGYKQRPINEFVDEIEELMSKYEVKMFHIFDEYFFGSIERVREFLRIKKEKGLQFYWSAAIRANLFKRKISIEFLKELKAAGCIELGLGAESGSQRVLNLLKKDIKVEDILLTNQMMRAAQLPVAYAFMAGIPGETAAEFKQTVALIFKLCEDNPNARIMGPQLYRPYPGAPLYTVALSYGLEMPKMLEDWVRVFASGEDFDLLPARKFPWIEQPRIITRARETLNNYYIAKRSGVGPIRWLAKAFLLVITRFRLRYGFYAFPIETILRLIYSKKRHIISEMF